MHPIRLLPIVLCWGSAAFAGDLVLRRAELTLGGVGRFEYEATADADGVVALDVRRADVDDVLKSLVTLGDRPIRSLQLAGPDDAAAFAGLPFGAEALADPLALLAGLRGTAIELRDASGREVVLRGRLLAAVRQAEPVSGTTTVERTRVSVLTELGLRQFVLEEAGSLRLADPVLQAALDAALASRRGRATDERRTIRLRVDGAGPVRLAVVTAAPLWKATYRLELPSTGDDAMLQGWAVLENASAQDWRGVSVALRSGNPVAFHQALYAVANVTRPEVEVDRAAHPEPQAEAATVGAPPPPAPPPPAPPPPAPPPPAPPSPAFAPALRAMKVAPVAAAVATAGIAATSFALRDPIDLPAGHTASVPFLQARVPARAIDLAGFEQAHPRAAVRLTNATGLGLPGGAVATFDETGFSGDALLDPLAAGETRLLSFAEDAAVTLAWRRREAREVVGVTVAGGVARLTRRERSVTEIEIGGAAEAGRALLLELPVTDGATLAVEGGRLAETTAESWRVEAGRVPRVVLTVDRPEREEIALTGDPAAVLALLDVPALSAPARTALRTVVALRQEEAAREAARDGLRTRREQLEQEETRLRQNLPVVPEADPLHGRLLRQLDLAETALTGLAAELDRAEAAVAAAHAATAAAIAALAIEG